MTFFVSMCVALLMATVADGKIVKPPLNTAVELAGSVTLYCKSDIIYTQPDWRFSKNGELANQSSLASQCEIRNANFTHYTAKGGDPGECILTISNATFGLAGVYTCADNSGYSSAMLTVSSMKVIVNHTTKVVKGDVINMTCIVKYAQPEAPAPQQKVSLKWNIPGASITERVISDDTLLTTALVTVKEDNIPAYSCGLSLGAPPSTPMFAENPNEDAVRQSAPALDNTDPKKPGKTSSTSSTVIIGAAAGGAGALLLLGVIAVTAYICLKKKNAGTSGSSQEKKKEEKTETSAEEN